MFVWQIPDSIVEEDIRLEFAQRNAFLDTSF